MKSLVRIGLPIGLLLVVIVYWTHRVPLRVSTTDRTAIEAVVGPETVRTDLKNAPFDAQIDYVRLVQKRLQDSIVLDHEIPMAREREPMDLVERGAGLCFDRSRFLEKTFRLAGLRTRHVAVYPTARNQGVGYMLQGGIPSHATLEIKTARGWMIVDSNVPWMARSADGDPLSFQDISDTTDWLKPPILGYDYYYNDEAVYIYGLYSRHGLFYPPFNRLPDVNFSELLHNL